MPKAKGFTVVGTQLWKGKVLLLVTSHPGQSWPVPG